MKTFLKFFGLILLVFVACSKEETPRFAVNPTTITIPCTGESETINVNSNLSWVIAGKSGWLELSSLSGTGDGLVIVSADENKVTKERTCKLTVMSVDGNFSQTVNIVQEGVEAELSVDRNVVTLSYEENASAQFSVRANSDWVLSFNKDWLEVKNTVSTTSGNTSVEIYAKSENFSDETRSTDITVSLVNDPSKNVVIKVTQDPALAPNCKITLSNVDIMDDGIAGDISFTQEVVGYIELYCEATVVNTLPLNLLYQVVSENGSMCEKKYDFFWSPNDLEIQKEYVYCVVPYNSKGKFGKIETYRFTLPASTITKDAQFTMAQSESLWQIDVTRGPQCSKYYMFYYSGDNAIMWYDIVRNFNSAAFIHLAFKPYIKDHGDNYYINDARFTIPYNRPIFVTSWGLDDKGVYSSHLKWRYYPPTSNSFDSELQSSEKSEKSYYKGALKPDPEDLHKLMSEFRMVVMQR